jgi:hypothetical protein
MAGHIGRRSTRRRPAAATRAASASSSYSRWRYGLDLGDPAERPAQPLG